MLLNEFVEKNTLSFTPFYYQRNEKTGRKQYIPKIGKDWQKLNFNECKEKITNKQFNEGLMLNLNNKFIVFDTDTKESYDFFNILIKKFSEHLKTPIKPLILKSYSNAEGYATENEKKYKFHFWFKLNENSEAVKKLLELTGGKNRTNILNQNGLDILLFSCVESSKNKFEEPPIIPDIILLYINKYLLGTQATKEKEFNHKMKEEGEIQFLLNRLNNSWADDYEKWRNISFIIKKEIPNSKGLEILKEFSKRSSKYEEAKVIDFWNRIGENKGGLTIGSLRYYVKNENDIGYKEYTKQYKKIKDYETVKEEFEKTAFKIKHPISYCYIDEEDDLIIATKTDFKNIFENLFYEEEKGDKIKKKNFINKWFSDENIRTYSKIDFMPKMKCPEYIYNSFKGLKVEHAEHKENLKFEDSIIYNHMMLMCNNDLNIFNYFCYWLNNRLFYPYKLPNTSLIFRGIEGSGKSCFFNWLGNNILGKNYYTESSFCEHILGHFNPLIKNKLLIIINEMKSEDGSRYKETIKDVITSEKLDINEKGSKQYKIKNNTGFIFLTNNFNVIRADKNDRRFIFIEMSDEKANNNQYFKELFRAFNSGKYNKSFYEFIKGFDSLNYDFTGNRPETEYNKQVKLLNFSPIEKYFMDLADNNKLKEEYKIKGLYEDFKDWLYENDINYKISSVKFGIELERIKFATKERTSSHRFYKINIGNITNHFSGFI